MKAISQPNNDFWSNVPIISFTVIILMILAYIGFYLDTDRNADNSFFNLIAPSLEKIRNESYWGLFTSSLLEPNIIFLVWGIGWMIYFGIKIENYIRVYSYILLVLSSLIVPELFQILIFQNTGSGMGGVVTTLCGLLWFRSEFAQSEWFFSTFEKLSLTLFIFICILVDATGIYSLGIGALIGGFVWGLFLGYIITVRKVILRILIPIVIFGILLVPVFWAPWQTSWLVNQAQKYEKLNEMEKAKEIYRNVLAKDKDYTPAIDGLTDILYKEFEQYFDKEEYDKAEATRLRILEIDPANERAKKNLEIINHNKFNKMGQEASDLLKQKKLEEAEKLCVEILKNKPEDKFAKECLQFIQNSKK